MDAVPAGLDRPLGEALLEPHRSYLGALAPVLDHPGLRALAHVTGGGLPENLPRVLPPGVRAVVDIGSWPVPPLFRLVEELTPRMTVDERYRTLNMGIGMVLVCAPDAADELRGALGEPSWVIGRLEAGAGGVELRPPSVRAASADR
jgi:phosphoribosylaminoimidazole (AIR) synthetase